MLRIGRTVGTLVCGVGVALLAAAQPADVPAAAQPTPGAADLIGLELAHEVWQHVVPDVLTPLPRAIAQPAQWSSALVRAGDVTAIARAQRDFERRADASLRELHASISYAERRELQTYVDAARIELPQVRREALATTACHGNARSGLDLAAAHIAADTLHAERLRQIVSGLATVLDADSFGRVLARAMSGESRAHFRTIGSVVSAEARAARYTALSGDALVAELRRVCGGVWSHHSDAKPA